MYFVCNKQSTSKRKSLKISVISSTTKTITNYFFFSDSHGDNLFQGWVKWDGNKPVMHPWTTYPIKWSTTVQITDFDLNLMVDAFKCRLSFSKFSG